VEQFARLPKDLPDMYMANEQLAEAVKVLRQAADAVESLLGGPAKAEVASVAPRKSDERFAGKDPVESFEDRMTRISAEAQAATFASADAGADEEPAAPSTAEWACPKHGTAAVIELKAKGGRVIRACDKCDQVEP